MKLEDYREMNIKIGDILDYCKKAEQTALELERTCCDNAMSGRTNDLLAIAYFSELAKIYGYEIPNMIKCIADEYAEKENKSLYELIIFSGEEDEETVYAELTSEEYEIIEKDRKGLLHKEHIVTLTDGRQIESGIIDSIKQYQSNKACFE